MPPAPRSPGTTGLDVSILGFIVAAVGFYGAIFADTTARTPDLVRFGETSADAAPPAAVPQDSALLLLARSGDDASASGGREVSLELLGALDPVWSFLMLVGVTMVVAGPLWAWINL